MTAVVWRRSDGGAGGVGGRLGPRGPRRGSAFAPAERTGPAVFRLDLSDAQREQLTEAKREELIAQLETLVQRFPDDSPRKPDLLFQLGEAYWEKSKALRRAETEAASEHATGPTTGAVTRSGPVRWTPTPACSRPFRSTSGATRCCSRWPTTSRTSAATTRPWNSTARSSATSRSRGTRRTRGSSSETTPSTRATSPRRRTPTSTPRAWARRGCGATRPTSWPGATSISATSRGRARSWPGSWTGAPAGRRRCRTSAPRRWWT